MKIERLLAVSLILILLSGFGESWAKGDRGREIASPELSFEEAEYDFGDVWERGKRERYEFLFHNSGSAPLLITRTITSCKCLNVNFSKRPVMPGDSAIITVTFNPRRQQGMFYKAIQIFSNAPERQHILVVKGRVILESEEQHR